MNPSEILKKYWGHDRFRPLQEDIITSVLDKKDTLALLPTGGGKSICFQVPAMMADGICLVISPLIALMKDQVEGLKRKGINVLAIYSGMSYPDIKKTLQNASFGNYKFLYLSPERLETKLFLEFLPALKPALIAVDEAHCISQWGYDFRPAYKRIAALRESLPGVPVIALTASATPIVQQDICESLLFGRDSNRFEQSFAREALSYSAFTPVSKEKKLEEILQNVKGTTIIYCRSRKDTMKLCELLRMQQIPAEYYHAGLPAEKRTAKQDAWINNKTRVIVCTNAFGMGIDKPDVRLVVHYGLPDCLENYYQEAGRAGRDNKRAYAVLLYYPHETKDLFANLEVRYPTPEKLKLIYKALMNYLQVAAGSGEGISYDLDIAVFAQNFKLNILEATYGIQALAQEGLISFSESNWRAASAEFCVNKNDLAQFETTEPDCEPIIKGLLRSYEGIFDFPVTIYETLLANFLKMPREILIQHLKKMHAAGIIDYKPSSEKPEILLLKNRMYNDDLRIDNKDAITRKKEGELRARAITAFAEEKFRCRNKMISQYFGDGTAKDCGICDNCINNKTAMPCKQEFADASEKLSALLHARAISLKEIFLLMKPMKERAVWLVLNFLLSEELIVSAGDDLLQSKQRAGK